MGSGKDYTSHDTILRAKKTKGLFMQVKAVLSAKEEKKGKLTREMVRKLSARARDYMVAYYKLHQKQR